MLHDFFDAARRRWPDRVAIDIPPGRDRPSRATLTYAALARRSHAIARLVGRDITALLLPRTNVDAFAAPLGVLRAGGAFLALDPSFPDTRLRVIASDARPAAVLTDAAGLARLSGLDLGVPLINLDVLDAPPDEADDEADAAPSPSALPADPRALAYVIYTSGTSGQPKGVLVEHEAIANLVRGDLDEFHLRDGDRVAQGSSHAYDSSIEEIWLALSAGATVVVMDDGIVRAGPDLPSWLRNERITVLCPPPTLLRTMPAQAAGELPDLRLIYAGGEAMTPDLVATWAPGRRLVNGYGPTECAVTAIRGDVHPGEPVTIGCPVPGVQAWVLDEALAEVRAGGRGELCLGGAGLARGYHGAPDLTSARFPTHPRFGRIYRTGDLAHVGLDGRFVCHGRIDAQVKVRGYRVELEEIETQLARIPGIRAAACRVDADSARPALAAFLVLEAGAPRPTVESIREHLRRTLPPYMMPNAYRWIDRLPTSTGGKLNRAALPAVEIAIDADESTSPIALAATTLEVRLEHALRRLIGRAQPVSIDDDFFSSLGGDSLRAAEFTTVLRDDPVTRAATVRDIYEAPTIRRLAARLDVADAGATADTDPGPAAAALPAAAAVVVTTIAQLAWLIAALVATCVAGVGIVTELSVLLQGRSLVWVLVVAPVLVAGGLAAYTVGTVIATVFVKRVFIGRYQPVRVPLWTWVYVRHWVVRHTAGAVPWSLLMGTELHSMVLRALGARVGRRVHIHRGVDLRQGGWDLLDLGDDVTIGADAELRLVDLDAQHLVIGPIAVGAGATVETRGGLSSDTRMGAGAYLTALSDLASGDVVPAGACWSGVPARPAGVAPPAPDLTSDAREWSAAAWAAILITGEALTTLIVALPVALIVGAIAWRSGLTIEDLFAWVADPRWAVESPGWLLLVGVVPGIVTIWWTAVVMRILGACQPGVVPRMSVTYARAWIKTGLLTLAGNWLSGTVMWPMWLRAAGATIGAGSEISTIVDVLPEQLTIGPTSFLADGVYLGGPVLHRGRVHFAPTRLGSQAFIGNHAVIPAGARVADGVLIGVSTVASPAMEEPHTSWFGHPPFALPRRPPEGWDRALTHDPGVIRRVNRWCWEWLRFGLPVTPIVLFLIWSRALSGLSEAASPLVFAGAIVPFVTIAAGAAACLVVLVLKWLLLGRVSPGEHALWSCWCSRWDFLYVAWGQWARPVLSTLEGTLILPWYLRAMGARIGRRVALGDGAAQVVDPDMLEIDDGATVQAQFQAHTFEDRVLKIDRVRIHAGATVAAGVVLLYGADLGPGASVSAHSVVMKREHLRAGRRYTGCPVRG